MEYMQIIVPIAIFFLSIITGVIGWFARQIYDMAKSTASTLADHQLEVARHYVPNDRLEKMLERFDGRLNDIHVLAAQQWTHQK